MRAKTAQTFLGSNLRYSKWFVSEIIVVGVSKKTVFLSRHSPIIPFKKDELGGCHHHFEQIHPQMWDAR